MTSPPGSGDKPFTTDQIRQRANSWNLAADVGLLATLQAFSERLSTQAERVQSELNGLLDESAATRCRLRTAATQLMLVSGSRFVESRVCEDDSAETAAAAAANVVEKPVVSKEDSQKEVHARLCQALSLGGDILDKAYERLEVSDSDSDGQSGDSLPAAVEPADPYLHRPLPHIIASRQFEDDDSVGLQLGGGPPAADTEDDLTDQETAGELLDYPERGDVASSAAPAATVQARATLPPPTADDGWSDSSADMFDPRTQMAAAAGGQKTTSVEPSDQPRHRSGSRAPREGDLFAADSDSETETGDGELFGAGRPAAGLWTAGTAAAVAAGATERLTRLMDGPPPDDADSDMSEQGEENVTAAPAQPTTPSKRMPAGAVAMFGGLDPFAATRRTDGMSSSSDEDGPPTAAAAARRRRSGPKLHSRPINAERSTLPVSDEDDDDDLFGGRAAPAPASRQSGKPASAAAALAQKAAAGAQKTAVPAQKATAAAKSKPATPAAAAKPSAGLFSSSDDEDMFQAAARARETAARTAAATEKSAASPASASTAPVAAAAAAAATAAKAPARGLFDSDSDDDIFSFVTPSRSTGSSVPETAPGAAAAGAVREPEPPDDPPPPARSGPASAAAPAGAVRVLTSSTGVENVRAMATVPRHAATVPDAASKTVPSPAAAPAVATATAAAATAATQAAAAAGTQKPQKAAAKKAQKPVSSLFSSSSEEDLFASASSARRAPAARPAPAPTPASQPTPAPVSAPATKPAPEPAPSLSATAPARLSAPEPKPESAPAPAPASVAPVTDVLDVPSEPPPAVSEPASKAPKAAVPAAAQRKAVSASLFDSSSDEDDLFHPASATGGGATGRATTSTAQAGSKTDVAAASAASKVEATSRSNVKATAPQQKSEQSAVKADAPQQASPVRSAEARPKEDNFSPTKDTLATTEAEATPSAAEAVPRADGDSPAATADAVDSGNAGTASARPTSQSGPKGLSALTASIEQQLGRSAGRRTAGPVGGVALFAGAPPPRSRTSPSPSSPTSPSSPPPLSSPPTSPTERTPQSPPTSPAPGPLPGQVTAAAAAPSESVRRRAGPAQRARPVSMPVGRSEAMSPPPLSSPTSPTKTTVAAPGVAVSLGPAVAPDTLPSLTKARARGPVKRRPSRKKTGSNRLSLPVEPSGYLPDLTADGPADGLEDVPAQRSEERTAERTEERQEERPAPVARKAPPAGAQRLPGALTGELRNRLARRAEAVAAGDKDDTDGAAGSPRPDQPVVMPPEATTLRERTGLNVAPAAGGSGGPLTPVDAPRGASELPSTVPETPAAPERLTLPPTGVSAVPATPGSISSPTASEGQSPVSPTAASQSPRPSPSPRPSVPARPVVPGRPSGTTPSLAALPAASSGVSALSASAAAPASPAKTVEPAATPPTTPSRAAASLFDSDSDEDLFHLPTPRPTEKAKPSTPHSDVDGGAGASLEPDADTTRLPRVEEDDGETAATEPVSKESDISPPSGASLEPKASPTVKPDTAPKPKSAVSPPPSPSSPGPSDSLASAETELPPERDTTSPPPVPQPPPVTDLFSDSEEEDLFLPVSSVARTLSNVAEDVTSAPATSAAVLADSDGGRSEDGDEPLPKDERSDKEGVKLDTGVVADGPAENEDAIPDETPPTRNKDVDLAPSPVPEPLPTSAIPDSSAVPPPDVPPSAEDEPPKSSFDIFDSDSDEDLFQTMPKPKPTAKEAMSTAEKSKPPALEELKPAVEKPKPPAKEPKPVAEEPKPTAKESTPAANAPEETRNVFSVGEESFVSDIVQRDLAADVPTASLQSGKTASEEVGDDGALTKDSEEPASTKERRLSGDRIEASSDPAAPSSTAISTTAEQFSKTPPKTVDAIFDSDSDEDLFLTAKPKLAGTPVSSAGVSLRKNSSDDRSAVASSPTPVESPLLEDEPPSLQENLPDFSSTTDSPSSEPASVPNGDVEDTAGGVVGDTTSGRCQSPPVADSVPDAGTVEPDEPASDMNGDGGPDEPLEEETLEEELPSTEAVSNGAATEAPGTSAAAAATATPDGEMLLPREPVGDEDRAPPEDAPVQASSVAVPVTSAAPVAPAAPVTPAAPVAPATNITPTVPAVPTATATAKPGSSLFDSESDEENLFQTIKPKSSVKTPTMNQKDPSLGPAAISSSVTHSRGAEGLAPSGGDEAANVIGVATDAVTSKAIDEEPEMREEASPTIGESDTVRKTPVAPAVSASTVAIAASKAPLQPVKPAGDLFDDSDDDDDDDLFNSMQKSKQAPAKGLSGKNTSAKKSAPPVTPSSNTAGTSNDKQHVEKKSKKQSSNVGEVKSEPPPSQPASRNAPLPRSQRRETSKPSRSLFSSDSDEEDLFSTAKNRPVGTPGASKVKPASSSQQPATSKSATGASAAASTRVTSTASAVPDVTPTPVQAPAPVPGAAATLVPVSATAPAPAAHPAPAPTPALVPAPARAPVQSPTSASAPAPVPAAVPAPARPSVPISPLEDSDDDDLFGSIKNAPRPARHKAADRDASAATAAAVTTVTGVSRRVIPAAPSVASSAVPAAASGPAKSAAPRQDKAKTAPSVGKASSNARAPPPKSASLFSDDDDDGDLFSSATTAVPTPRVPGRTTGRLFSDSDDDDDTPTPMPAAVKQKATTPTASTRRPEQTKTTAGAAAAAAAAGGTGAVTDADKGLLKPAAYDPLSGLLDD